MTGYLSALLAVSLAGVALWGVLGHREADSARAALRASEARASAAEAEAAAARFNHAVAIEALQDAERQRASLAATLDQWSKRHADDLSRPADPVLLDLIDRLQPGPGRDRTGAD